MAELSTKVFARLDANNCIVQCEGGVTFENIKDISEWVAIDEGVGSKYERCQAEYFDKPLREFPSGIPLYRWDGSQVVPRSAEELDADRAAWAARLAAAEAERQATSPEARLDALELAMCEADEANEAWRTEIENALCEIDEESEG